MKIETGNSGTYCGTISQNASELLYYGRITRGFPCLLPVKYFANILKSVDFFGSDWSQFRPCWSTDRLHKLSHSIHSVTRTHDSTIPILPVVVFFNYKDCSLAGTLKKGH